MPDVEFTVSPVTVEIGPELVLAGHSMLLMPLTVYIGDESEMGNAPNMPLYGQVRIRLSVVMNRIRNMILGSAEVEINPVYAKTATPPESAVPTDCPKNAVYPAIPCGNDSKYYPANPKNCRC